MRKFKLLVLTDHKSHSKENSIYSLLRAMRRHPYCGRIDVASRGNVINDFFFHQFLFASIFTSEINDQFFYHPDGKCFTTQLQKNSLSIYDAILLRLPHPVKDGFWKFLQNSYPETQIINAPSGIEKVGNKAFLLNVPSLCPPIKLCTSVEDIIAFKRQFPIVLKPLKGYGGVGIVKIDGDKCWQGKTEMDFKGYIGSLKTQSFRFLAMKFMNNVCLGDKRIVVVNGKIMGASLRLPPENSWLCNASQGGQSVATFLEKEEIHIACRLSAILSKMGIVIFGFDTLVDDYNKRVLSEINVQSVGGLMQIEHLNQQPIVKEIADLLWSHVKKLHNEKENAYN